jgi:hypothetical protein
MKKCGKSSSKILFLTIQIFLITTYLSHNSVAETSKDPLCFDFSVPVKTPLKAYKGTKAKNKDVTDSGKFTYSGGGIWGSALGKVDLPIQNIYQLLLDHYTIKDPGKVRLKVYPQERPGFQDFHVVMVTVPTPIFNVNWEEEWAYTIPEGTSTSPKKVVVSYQKTTGTRYVPHLCGSIVLNSLGPQSTEVYLYEEINALGKRSPGDTVKGHIGTLETLRRQIASAKTPAKIN